MNMQRIWRTALLSLSLGAIIGGVFVYFLMKPEPRSGSSTTALREEVTNYRFIDPLLACNTPEATTGRYLELNDKLMRAIEKEKQAGRATMVSLYFQEYPSGRWVGIDENHQYAPASLLKIALMIAYFKDEQRHPGSLQKNYVYSRSLDDMNKIIPFDATSSLLVGHSYTVEQLVHSMIIDSDNGAKDVLLDGADQTTLNGVYEDLQIPAPTDAVGYTISPKQYSLFFRILYNSTYLSRSLSEKAMSILAEATYADGIVAGLPKGVTEAHKFGEHVNSKDGSGTVSSVELHDCGVVYGPNLPYFLCVMTTGSTVEGLQATIQDISGVVYDALDTNIHK